MMTMFFEEDELVVRSLQESYYLESKTNKIDCSNDYLEPDKELLKAIEVVLQYYMSPTDFNEWRNYVHCKEKQP